MISDLIGFLLKIIMLLACLSLVITLSGVVIAFTVGTIRAINSWSPEEGNDPD